MERGNLIHAIQRLHDYVKVLEKKTDLPAFPSMPQRIVAFVCVKRLFWQFQAFFQDRDQMGHGEIRIGLEKLVGRRAPWIGTPDEFKPYPPGI